MRRTRHLPVCGILSAISAMGIGCAPQQPAPPRDVTNPQWTSELDGYVRAMPLGADMFQAPPGQVLGVHDDAAIARGDASSRRR
jgi:hypothetical protein